MKVVVRFLVVACVVVVLAVAVAGFVVTRSGFQKWLVQGNLPDGSSLASVKVGPAEASLSGLVLPLEDGTMLALDAVEVEYSLLAALFSRTVRVGRLQVSGLRVDMGSGAGDPAVATPGRSPTGTIAEPDLKASPPAGGPAPSDGTWLDPLYRVAEGGWIFEVGRVGIDGELTDAAGRKVSFSMEGGGVAPGETGRFVLDSRFAGIPVEGIGPSDFSTGAVVLLRQRSGGGFDRFEVEAHAAGRDAQDAALLDLQKSFTMEIDPAAREATFAFDYMLDWPHPEVVGPALAGLGAVSVRIEGAGSTMGPQLRVSSLSAEGASRGRNVLETELLQPVEIGGASALRGELLRLQVLDLPLAWAEPWMPVGTELSGGAVSGDFGVSRLDDGSLVLESRDPLRVGPVSLSQDGAPVLRGIRLAVSPRVDAFPDGPVRLALEDVQIDGPTGPLLTGTVEGVLQPETGDLTANASLEGFLPAILRQPVAGQALALQDGAVTMDLAVEWGDAPSAKAVVDVRRLRSPQQETVLPPLRAGVEMETSGPGTYSFHTSFETGDDRARGTRLGAVGEIRPGEPFGFDIKVRGTEVRVAELQRYADLAAPAGPAAAGEAGGPEVRPPVGSDPVPVVVVEDGAPPWAGSDGTFSMQIDRLILPDGFELSGLRAAGHVNEQRIALDAFEAGLGDGTLNGRGGMDHDPHATLSYALDLEVEAEGINPSALTADGSVPVQGLFDGTIDLEGKGPDPAGAVEAVRGTVNVRGSEGVVTAFELDETGELGVLGAGLLGVALKRPGLTEIARVVPYFKEIRYSELALDLERGDDGRIDLSTLRIIGEFLRIEGSGSLLAAELSEAMTAPMNLSLNLGSKGRLADSLDRLGLLQPEQAEDGFRDWIREISIGGTLQNPDTSGIERFLASAAQNALRGPQSVPAPEPADSVDGGATPDTQAELDESQPLTEEELRLRQIEQGIRILEDLF